MIALSDGATVAAVVLVGTLAGTLAPIILAQMTNRQARELKEMDWKREDQIQEKKEKAEAKARKQQTQLLHEVVEVKKQNTIIHRLVNSAYTASLNAQLVALEGKLMYAKQGDASPDELIAIQDDVNKLQGEIDERNEQQRLIDLQLIVDSDKTEKNQDPTT